MPVSPADATPTEAPATAAQTSTTIRPLASNHHGRNKGDQVGGAGRPWQWMAWRLCTPDDHGLGDGRHHRQLSSIFKQSIDVTFSASLLSSTAASYGLSVGRNGRRRKRRRALALKANPPLQPPNEANTFGIRGHIGGCNACQS